MPYAGLIKGTQRDWWEPKDITEAVHTPLTALQVPAYINKLM